MLNMDAADLWNETHLFIYLLRYVTVIYPLKFNVFGSRSNNSHTIADFSTIGWDTRLDGWSLRKIRKLISKWGRRHFFFNYCIGSFNKDARFLNINKTSCVWDIHSIFFLFERIFYGIKYGI